MIFFLGPKIFEGQSESFICCKSLFDGYNHFGSKNSIREILALESPESRKSSERPSATLCVKCMGGAISYPAMTIETGWTCTIQTFRTKTKKQLFWSFRIDDMGQN